MIDLSQFENPAPDIYIFKKWNWDYLEAEKFQLECVDFVNSNPHLTLFIICSHPHSFTLGRGLQKIKETTKIDLVDFDPNLSVPFPLHQIKRGGGLTFHYPGQMVIYPIMNLTVHKKAVFDLMLTIMEFCKNRLELQFNLFGTEIKRDLLGLWFDNGFARAKIASIGLAVSRFNTYHGLALNFFSDHEMFMALKSLHPCGLPGDLYKDVEFLLDKKLNHHERDLFAEGLIGDMITYLNPDYRMIDKQRSSSLINDSISETV